MHQRCS